VRPPAGKRGRSFLASADGRSDLRIATSVAKLPGPSRRDDETNPAWRPPVSGALKHNVRIHGALDERSGESVVTITRDAPQVVGPSPIEQ
jgi:hypothetical protein